MALIAWIAIGEHLAYRKRFVGALTPQQWQAIQRETFAEWRLRVLRPGHRVMISQEKSGNYMLIARTPDGRLALYHRKTTNDSKHMSERFLDGQGGEYRTAKAPEALSAQHRVIDNHYFRWNWTVESERHGSIYEFNKPIAGRLQALVVVDGVTVCDQVVDWDAEPVTP